MINFYPKFFISDAPVVPGGRMQILEDGGLLVAKVRTTDAGKYSCVRANEAGSARGEAYVTVMVSI